MAKFTTPKRLYTGSPTVETQLFKASTALSAVVKQVMVANNSAAAITFSLWLIAKGGALGSGQKIANAITVNANDIQFMELYLPLEEGEILSGLLSAAGGVLVVSGDVIT